MQEDLPIHSVIPEILKSLEHDATLILQAPPGAGKSTVLPLFLMDAKWLSGRKILMLEPRRLAAKSVAWRLAKSLNEEVGRSVGYRVRFETCISTETKIEVVTEGILTRMLQHDNSLSDYGIIIFDEFHERSLHADLSLALCREIQEVLRNDLRIMIMSATLDGENLSALMGNTRVISSQGRQYPIAYNYIEPDQSLPIAHNTSRVILKALREEQGDILVFLPGSGEILRTIKFLENENISTGIYALYGDLPYDQQQKALQPDPAGRRKIVLSTSIAETSLTIEGIRIVIDCGYARIPRYDLRTGLTRLETVRVTKDTADQRAGRAGRLGPGICYRLWPERTNHQLVEHRKPEILEADLTSLVLELAHWGCHDPNQLNWITAPPPAGITQARQLLENLDALKDGRITKQGNELLKFSTHPRIAHLLLYGLEHNLSAQAADVAALLEERDPISKEAGTDILLRMNLLRSWRNQERVNADRGIVERIDRISKQWCKILGVKQGNNIVSADESGRLIAAAYPERIAKKEGTSGRYRLANGRAARLPAHDPLNNEEWIAIAQLDAGSTEGKIFLASAFDPAEILKQTKGEEVLGWDARQGIIFARREWKIGNLIAMQKPVANPAAEHVSSILYEVVQQEGLTLFNWTEEVKQFRARVMSLKIWRTDLSLPDLGDDQLIKTIADWAVDGFQNIRRREDFYKLNLLTMLESIINWEQQSILNKLAPKKIPVPSGSEIALHYSADGSLPVLAVRLQEVFGWSDSPMINEGRTGILLHLLSPGYRPVQVTQDLKSFWNTTYPEVRKELRIRYQKHSWPEDPWTAQAVRGAKKRKK